MKKIILVVRFLSYVTEIITYYSLELLDTRLKIGENNVIFDEKK